ncbi:unnamed protein product [Gongylonema pulchrum]|uniref:glucuronosyltransferase n=1 Tax=Gongylonema pulchrum TaxID=637853 RepID=A0A183CZ63_9BILA|nr:unnamed protein product [Gongylonema pulchrum]
MRLYCFVPLLPILILHVHRSASYKILIFSPRVGYSHVNYFGQIADILVEAGYDVVVYLVNMDPDVHSNGTRLARVVEDSHSPFLLETKNLNKRIWHNDGGSVLEIYKVRFTAFYTNNVLKNDKVLEYLRSEKFDLGITEAISFCGYRIFEKIGLKTYITGFTSNLVEIISDKLGVSSNPSYIPESSEAWVRIYLDENMIESVGRSSFAFVNSEELLEFPRLLSHKIVYIGGVAVEKPKPLNEDYGKLMDAAADGAVLISFGSVAKSVLMTDQQKDAFCNAFKAFPKVKFIWKYEINDSVATDLPNVFKGNWIPQTDFLGNFYFYAVFAAMQC